MNIKLTVTHLSTGWLCVYFCLHSWALCIVQHYLICCNHHVSHMRFRNQARSVPKPSKANYLALNNMQTSEIKKTNPNIWIFSSIKSKYWYSFMIYNFSFYFCPSSFLVSLWSNLMNGVQGNALIELTHGPWAEGSIHHLTTAHQHVWSFEMCVTLKNVRPRTWQDTEGENVGWLGHCCLLSVRWL